MQTLLGETAQVDYGELLARLTGLRHSATSLQQNKGDMQSDIDRLQNELQQANDHAQAQKRENDKLQTEQVALGQTLGAKEQALAAKDGRILELQQQQKVSETFWWYTIV